MIYDIAVIGSGIGGSIISFYLKKEGVKVLNIDRSKIAATGGSGAAGAFISPKLGKKSLLLEFTNRAFLYATNFYLKNFSSYFINSPIIRAAKDSRDYSYFNEYSSYMPEPFEIVDSNKLKNLGFNIDVGAFIFERGGDISNTQALCEALLEGVDRVQLDVKSIIKRKEYWQIGDKIKAKKVILSTGYENNLADLRYMGIGKIWGSRGDYFANFSLAYSFHQKFSISSVRDGYLKIGATHIRGKMGCLYCDGNPLSSMEQEAKAILKKELRLKKLYCGFRSSSRDYFPLVGKVVDSSLMLEKYPNIIHGQKAPFLYYKDLYILGGLGGRGFVFAPLLGEILKDYILFNKEIPSFLEPNRLFFKWVRRERESLKQG
ncbi:MAG: FAD-dependent oxidoreductase [Epsilonproteobacteria bacterium]|nr:FAD-dependent oxidoreductase [Campylobacterota bacterium]